MGGPGDYHAKWSKSDRKINIVWYCLHMEPKKWYKWTYLQNRNRFTRLTEQIYGYTGRRVGRGRDRLGVWDWLVHTAVSKMKCVSMKKIKKGTCLKCRRVLIE